MSIIGTLVDAFSPGGVRGQQHQRFEEGIQKEEEARAQQDALDRQREHDMQFHEALMQQGYKPSVNGIVNETLTAPGNSELGMGPVSGNLMRPVDPARLFKFKDHTGADVAYERPASLMDQLKYQWDSSAPVREGQAQQTQRTARASSQGSAEGKSAADQENLAANGVDLSDEDAARLGLPRGSRVLRTEMANLAGKVQPAQIRTQGAFDRTKYRTDLQTQTQQAIADRKAEQEDVKLKTQQGWNAVRERLAGQQEAGRNTRAANAQAGMAKRQQTRIGVDEKLHGQWLNQAFDEEQKQLQAQALLGETEEPGMLGGLFGSNKVRAVEDGQEFTDPWTGKKATMNIFQRQRIKNALDTSERKREDLQSRADEIASRYGLGGKPAEAPAGAAPTGGKAQPFKVGQTVYDKSGKPHKVTGYDKSGKVLTD